jgi:AraC-like DNA-binding protein
VQHVSITPTSPLAEFIERFWYFSDAPVHQKVRVVPSGTIELVFNLNDDELGFYDTKQSGTYKGFSGAVFSGAHARPLFVDSREHVVGVHFKPGGAFRFLGIPASKLADTHVDVEVVWGKSTQDLREQLCAPVSPAERFRVLERALVARLKNASPEHRAVRAALDIFGRDPCQAKTRDLAAHLGLSQRHFIKVFSDQVGFTPKQFGRVKRFRRALKLTRRSSAPDWADVAVACGYYDQSHLIHDFQAFSGSSPTEFHRRHSERDLMTAPIGE